MLLHGTLVCLFFSFMFYFFNILVAMKSLDINVYYSDILDELIIFWNKPNAADVTGIIKGFSN